MRKVLLGLCLITLLPLLAMGFGTLVPRPITFSANADDPGREIAADTRILVLSNPIHTDIALPATPEVLKVLSFVSDGGLELDYPGAKWIILGWGSRSFYIETPTWGDLKAGPVINALTWDQSVMHVQRAGEIPLDQVFVQAIDLKEKDFEQLLDEIRKSFKSPDSSGPQAILGAAYGEHDIFFPAKGGFNALMGCNTWTARMLRIAGVKTGLWTPLPITLRWSLELHNSL
jgi:uncharacterized protein (TIGR02117 family)